MDEVPAHDNWLTGPEGERLRGLPYTKRREEARLGRWTAKRAVARTLALPDAPDDLPEVVIRNASDGAPEVFLDGRRAQVEISMTDRADWAVCVVVQSEGSIGCDLELVEPRSPAFVADYFTPAEQARVAAEPDRSDLLANLIWSAKESALKVLRTGLRRDTRSVQVTLTGDSDQGWRSLRVRSNEGQEFAGWWRQFGEFVLTYTGEAETGPPVTLTHPPPLETATPTHSWLDNPLTPRA